MSCNRQPGVGATAISQSSALIRPQRPLAFAFALWWVSGARINNPGSRENEDVDKLRGAVWVCRWGSVGKNSSPRPCGKPRITQKWRWVASWSLEPCKGHCIWVFPQATDTDPDAESRYTAQTRTFRGLARLDRFLVTAKQYCSGSRRVDR